MLEQLLDPKNLAAMGGVLATLLVQFTASHGVAVDQGTANSLSLGILGLAGSLVLGHAHVQHAETHAEANENVAKITASMPPS